MKKLLWLLFLCGCASKDLQKLPEGELVFPNGRYQQSVQVLVLAKGHEKDFDFDCIVQKSSEEFLFVGYNSFGISLFKIREKSGQAVEVESSISQIVKNKEFFLKVFALVKNVINLKKTDPRLQNNQILLKEKGIESQVTLSDYDKAGMPLKILVETLGQYKIDIKTESYKL